MPVSRAETACTSLGHTSTFAAMDRIFLALKGAAMGVAEVIPGVSGGTIAFITGIYETLLQSIANFSPGRVVATFREGGVSAVWKDVNGPFLVNLAVGMFLGVLVGVFGVSHLLETYPEILWAFFFGLIVGSALYIGRQVTGWGVAEIVAIAVGAGVAYYITAASPAQGNEALWFVFICGAIAVSALILPGISGSFILLLLGMYTYILPTVKEALSTFAGDKLLVLAVFGAGLLVGLFTFARFLSWLFQKYHAPTLALLTGFMIGSLNRLWPWQRILSYRTDSEGHEVPLLQEPVLPQNYEGETFLIWVIVAAIVGFSSVFLLEKLGSNKAPYEE